MNTSTSEIELVKFIPSPEGNYNLRDVIQLDSNYDVHPYIGKNCCLSLQERQLK